MFWTQDRGLTRWRQWMEVLDWLCTQVVGCRKDARPLPACTVHFRDSPLYNTKTHHCCCCQMRSVGGRTCRGREYSEKRGQHPKNVRTPTNNASTSCHEKSTSHVLHRSLDGLTDGRGRTGICPASCLYTQQQTKSSSNSSAVACCWWTSTLEFAGSQKLVIKFWVYHVPQGEVVAFELI